MEALRNDNAHYAHLNRKSGSTVRYRLIQSLTWNFGLELRANLINEFRELLQRCPGGPIRVHERGLDVLDAPFLFQRLIIARITLYGGCGRRFRLLWSSSSRGSGSIGSRSSGFSATCLITLGLSEGHWVVHIGRFDRLCCLQSKKKV